MFLKLKGYNTTIKQQKEKNKNPWLSQESNTGPQNNVLHLDSRDNWAYLY